MPFVEIELSCEPSFKKEWTKQQTDKAKEFAESAFLSQYSVKNAIEYFGLVYTISSSIAGLYPSAKQNLKEFGSDMGNLQYIAINEDDSIYFVFKKEGRISYDFYSWSFDPSP